jgi:16S rRNA (cytosine967-C5)-methyltransferase
MNARELARRVLARVDEGAYATLALSGELGRAKNLAPSDRGLATELVYGVLKQRRRLDAALAAYAPRGIDGLEARTLDAMRIGAYQILFLRVPAHAAVDDAVEAVKRARGSKLAGFANALLRKLAAQGEPASENLGVRASAPDWLVELAVRQNDAPEELLKAFNVPAPLWLRANTLRISAVELAERLKATRVEDDALRVEGLGDPAQRKEFGEGLFTVQDLAAQRVARMVEPQAGESILDACAGVGGKSTHLAALAGDRATIDAADLSERKLELGAESARRLGVKSVHPVVCDLTDPKAPLSPAYDRILLDAPCSGLGVLRRHPEAKWRRKPGDAAELAELQAQMLAALAPRVKKLLVYSVCTFTDEEGPRQVQRFLDENPQFAVEGEPLKTWPHRDDADAFFAVRLKRMR